MNDMLKSAPAQSTTILASLLTLAMGMPMMVFYAIGVLGPQLIADLDISQERLGWLTTSAFGLAAVLSPWVGTLVQRIGSRSGLKSLFLLVALSFTLMVLLPGFWGMVVALLFCGVAQSLANPATNQAIAQAVPPGRKATVVGLKQSGIQASALVAGLVLPSLSFWFGLRGAFAVWVPVALLLAYISTRLIPPKAVGPAAAQPFKVERPNSRLSMLMAIQFCAGLALSSFITFLGVYAHQLGVSAQLIGAMVGGFGVMGILSRVLLTPIGSRLRDETVLLFMLFLLPIAALLVMRLADHERYWPLWVGVLGMGLTVVATNAIAMSMLLRDPRFGLPARTAGMLSVGFFGGFAVGPPLFGVLLTLPGGYSVAWQFLLGALVAGSLLCVGLYRLRNRKEEI
ncbi:MAG: MFS transporter [Acidihalobacter sp.]|uniref:MFS transporter n=1 Tax=Acidihalobacter sp. TaxID=1872108 RepID=UPI00307CE6B9